MKLGRSNTKMEMLMISTLDQETVVTLQRSLQSITSLLALQTRHLPSVQLGLCGVVQHKEDVRLQVEWLQCVHD